MTPPTTEPTATAGPTTTEPPTTEPPTTTVGPTLPGTGGGSTGLFAWLGLVAMLGGGLTVALASRRLRMAPYAGRHALGTTR